MNVKSIFIVLLALASFAPTTHAQDAMIGEIRLFGGNFAPRDWSFCDGKTLPISQNQSLYSLLGTTYGGDGCTTFALPNLDGPLAQPTTVYTPITAAAPTALPSATTSTVKFVNKTDKVVTAYWVGRASKENVENAILPGATLEVESRANVLWRFKHDDKPVAEYVVETGTTSYDVKFAEIRNVPGNIQPRYIICLGGLYPSRS